MDNPLQKSLACIKCGRIYPRAQFRNARPVCPICPGEELKPWMESRLWTFVLFGAVGLPLVGLAMVAAARAIGMSSPAVQHGAFALVPGVVAILNLPAYIVGHRTGNYMIKRGGQQGLLIVLGFLFAVAVLVATGSYQSLVPVE